MRLPADQSRIDRPLGVTACTGPRFPLCSPPERED
jgi:hypothetical protein